MKVVELIERLQELPQNAEVFVYSLFDEGDDSASDVIVCSQSDICDKYGVRQYYCKGDSMAACHLRENKEQQVVVIGTFSYK